MVLSRGRTVLVADTAVNELPDAEFVKPGGGFFIWLTFPEGRDTQVVRGRAPEHGINFIHGAQFFVGGGGTNSLRVAFSLYGAEELKEAVGRLRNALAE